MSPATPIFVSAGEREEHCTCPHCGERIQRGAAVAVCGQCGTVHHRPCWEGHGDCGSYSCAPGRVADAVSRPVALRITSDEIERAVPLPTRRPVPNATAAPTLHTPSTRTSRLAVAAFVTALAGIPFFGPVTGLVAVALGSVALGSLRATGQRGTGFALTGVLLGLVDIVGWVVALGYFMSGPSQVVRLENLQADPAALENLDPVLSRAMHASVLIEATRGGWRGGSVIGSGVVLKLENHEALLVTNRHVVDGEYPGGEANPERLPTVHVLFLGQPPRAGTVTWLAPHGVDLALVRVAGDVPGAQAARWEPGRHARVGDPAFAIGNPHRLGWTHTQGAISQFRKQPSEGYDVRVIQTQTALNPGNSGGGLFDREGYLLGINTWTNDRRVSEGLNFAISLETLLDLHPPGLTPPAGAAPGGNR